MVPQVFFTLTITFQINTGAFKGNESLQTRKPGDVLAFVGLSYHSLLVRSWMLQLLVFYQSYPLNGKI